MEQTPSRVVVLRCAIETLGRRCATEIRLSLPEEIQVPYVSKDGGVVGPMSARDGAVYLVRCVEHGREYAGENGWGNTMRNIRDFRGIVSLSPCSDACTHAQGGDCRCSCGGIHHGEES